MYRTGAVSESMEEVFYKKSDSTARVKIFEKYLWKSSFFSIDLQRVKKLPPEVFYEKMCS